MHRSDTFCCDEVNIVNAGEGAPASRNRRVATATSLALVLTATAAYWYWAQGPIPTSARPPARAAVPVSIAVADRQDVPVYLIGLGTVQASFTIGIHSQWAEASAVHHCCDRTNNPNWGRAGLERAQLELSVIIRRSYACAVSSSDGSIDLSHLEALPGTSCVSTVPQLKRERSLRARFAEANGNYHNISNTWLVRGFPSSSPLTPATQSGLPQPRCELGSRRTSGQSKRRSVSRCTRTRRAFSFPLVIG
jgi:hypothetical protein